MSIRVECSCGRTLKVNDSLAGKTGVCPSCGQPLDVPDSPSPIGDQPQPASEAADAEPTAQARPAGWRGGVLAGACVLVIGGAAAVYLSRYGAHLPGGTGTAAHPSGAPAADSVVLRADPNPVPGGPGPGKTVITWGTSDKAFNQVYVQYEGSQEKLFTEGEPGSKEVDWIWPDVTYEFRLYAGKDRKQLLSVLRVRKES